ncbi:MAG: peptide deformylase [Patescibacteria group bacterium]|jgi:methionyl-tRNA formyltransferase
MSKSRIITVPNPFLKEKTEKISSLDREVQIQIKEMIATLRREGGIGLAANQLGYKNQVIVIEFIDPEEKNHLPLTIFINPEIVKYSGETECFDEGCLSVPKIEFELERPAKLKLKYEDEHGHKLKIAPKGLLARILQHEIDHLNGILFIERARAQLFKNYPELKNTQIAFLGSGEFGAVICEGLIHLGVNLKIYTEAAKAAGRGKLLQSTPVADRAKKFGKQYTEITDIKKAVIDDCDLLICADFGQILPKQILEIPTIKAINIHPSLLPKYQGPSPIQTALLQGEKVTGVSIIEMTVKIDEGPIITQTEIDIAENDDYTTLRDKLATVGIKLLAKNLGEIVRGNLEGNPQPKNFMIKTRKFAKADGEISWNKTPPEIERQIRAFQPWPGTYTLIDNQRLLIHAVHMEKKRLVLDSVQLEGKTPTDFGSFLRGWHGQKPKWLSKIKINKNVSTG